MSLASGQAASRQVVHGQVVHGQVVRADVAPALEAPPLSGEIPAERILDLVYLARQTFGDRDLERELLALLEQQCRRLLPILSGDGPAVQRCDAAHTLKGAARAVGAWRLGHLADSLESMLTGETDGESLRKLLADLAEVTDQTCRAAAQGWRAA